MRRLIGAWAFQARLGVICHTLWKGTQSLLHLLGVMVIATVMFAVAGNVLIGWREAHLASVGAALEASGWRSCAAHFVRHII
jgi:hypothetical protein